MNRRLVVGILAGLAAIALAFVGGTYSNPVGSAQVPENAVGAGVLQLDLHGGGAHAQLDFRTLMPGATDRKLFWLAGNDPVSTMGGTLTLRFDHLADVAAPCSVSRDKALGEIASGIGGCTVSGERISGTPAQGNLSRLLALRVGYDTGAADAASCANDTGYQPLFPDQGPGNLRLDAGHDYVLTDGSTPLVVSPGHGVCLAVSAVWPPDENPVDQADPEHPVDNAAQGDALGVQVHFTLNQVTS